ncbi:MAG: WhiB family transcriptional regulator [Microthrixaceae bacterium]
MNQQSAQPSSSGHTTQVTVGAGQTTVPGMPGFDPLADNEPEESWQNFANCLGVDPDLFFPERGASTKEAKAVCKACVVREDCLEYALENSEKFGIWGGLSERERRRLRRARALARAAAAETRTA